MRKNYAPRNFDLTINLDLMIILTSFDLITLESLMLSVWNLVCGRFINLQKSSKFLTFGC